MIPRGGGGLVFASVLAMTPAQGPGPCRNPALTACTPELVAAVRRLGATLDSLAALPTPRDASAADRPVAVRFGTWLRDASGRVAAQSALARKSGPSPKPGVARLDYAVNTAALRDRLLAEADRFSFTSNDLKARLDLVVSSIRNTR